MQVRRRIDQAIAFVDHAVAAGSDTRARKLARKVAARLKKAARLAGTAGTRGRISSPCSEALSAMLADAGSRAARFAASTQ